MLQTMMNMILWDLINTEKVTSFIDDVIVEIEEEKAHNKIVIEVVWKLAENDLYVKLEKWKWKMKEVGFLEVVIRLKKIKMKEKKVKNILNWPTSKGVKDIWKFLGLVNYYWQFIKDSVAIARPLHNIVKKDQK